MPFSLTNKAALKGQRLVSKTTGRKHRVKFSERIAAAERKVVERKVAAERKPRQNTPLFQT
jgi:hypothetical protein